MRKGRQAGSIISFCEIGKIARFLSAHKDTFDYDLGKTVCLSVDSLDSFEQVPQDHAQSLVDSMVRSGDIL